MGKAYSIYETKAHLSEILRLVKSGKDVTVLERGVPIAKLIPFSSGETLVDHLKSLRSSGNLIRRNVTEEWPIGVAKEGSLKRFLDERE